MRPARISLAESAQRVAAARALVLGSHTMDHRVAELTELLARHGRAVGSVRDGAATTDADVARLCAPLRVGEVSRPSGTVIWAAAV